ncbi:hypothetical protein Sphch_3108 [Sphingobium chlorophenolicum L-1]|uniref:Helicase/UvrB N-terminal domain-containing protein n=1 Tax=Sphingobium chlorophenolicum L-1 TaxID=690566 RepID=F6F2R2_SPHCR|nr:hypothetical protein [Sphingobium chlorophenolicum]AEG50724.1 hypothetical protein Sphch_3108 [Sphingobium chlorophenolicum L-1]
MNQSLYSKSSSNFDICKDILVKSLRDFGSSLTPAIEVSFDSLIRKMDEGFKGYLKPSFYLSSLDTGMGKSLCIKSFIKSLIISGSIKDAGILICLQTKAEIKTFIDDCRLNEEHFSVLVYNDPLNNEGRGETGREEAPVLFTTHKMVRSRSGMSFAGAKDFYYRGKPRNLRIWDESLLPADPVSFSIDTLASVASVLRPYENQFVGEMDSFLKTVGWHKADDAIMVPDKLGKWAAGILSSGGRGVEKLSDRQVNVLEQFGQCAGRELTLSISAKTGRSLSGVVSDLPADLAPAIILDASGRLKATYDLWEQRRGNLVRLRPAVNDYSNVTINLWKTKAGKDALEDADIGRAIFRQIAKVIEAKPDERWLIVSFKPNDSLDVLEEVEASMSVPVALEYVHWGRHCAVNDYADIRNIIIIGSWRYPQGAYKALYQAATGEPAGEDNKEAVSRISTSEFQANFLQAFMRGHGRRSISGKAGECTAYVVASKSPNPTPLIAKALPGCIINEWSPVPIGLTGQAKQIADHLLAQRAAGVRTMGKSALGSAVGIRYKQQLSTLFRAYRFQQWLEDNGIKMTHREFVLTA